MHKEFADWYRTASLEPKGETLEARWKVIEKFVGKADEKELLSLVRLFLGLPTAEKAFADKFADAIRKADAAFPSAGNEIELRVLAGAACVACLDSAEQDPSASELVALAVTAGSFNRRRNNLIVPRVFETCEAFLMDRSARRFEDLKDGVDLASAATDLKKACTGGNTGQHLEKPMTAFLDRLEEKIEASNARQRLLQEEANVLWWLFGGHSHDLKLPFSKIESAALPLVAGHELAGLVEVRPGPVAFPGLLGRVLNGEAKPSKYTLAEAVNAAPMAWREGARSKTPEAVLDLCPVRTTVKRSLEVQDAKSWVKPAESATGLPISQKVEPLELATQCFREALLIQYVDGSNAY